MGAKKTALANMQKLIEYGVSFSLDDFGENTTGTLFKTLLAFKVNSSVSPGPTPIPINFPF